MSQSSRQLYYNYYDVVLTIIITSLLLLIIPHVVVTASLTTTTYYTYPSKLQSPIGQHTYTNVDGISALKYSDSTSYATLIPTANNKKKYKGKMILQIPKSVNKTNVSSLDFTIRVKFDQGGINNSELYKFKVRNFKSKKWQAIKSTKQIQGVTQWKNLVKSLTITNNLSDYLNPKGKMIVIIISKSNKDSLMMDMFQVAIVEESNEDVEFISVDQTNYSSGQSITLTFDTNQASATSWIAIYPASANSAALPSPSTMWNWAPSCSASSSSCSGSLVFNGNSDHGGEPWPLCNGEWKAHLINDALPPYNAIISSAKFTVTGEGDCNGVCKAATTTLSSKTHKQPVSGDVISRIAFGSCFHPDYQVSNDLWRHMRETFQAELWNWLGDNIYADGTDMNYKRIAYNDAKEDIYYSSYGPIGEPKIPVTGTWDDHDFGSNNKGDDYQCLLPSQNEFVSFFDIPPSDPRHPSQGANQQTGVYSSNIFSMPDGSGNGIHLINLDARSHRSPTFSTYGSCMYGASTMLGDEQWSWLESQLKVTSEIKIIGSGIQVLPPTNLSTESAGSYCAYDGSGGSFEQAMSDVGEGPQWRGTSYESWAEIPQQRTKLLQLCQKSINDGYTKKVIFVSGDQHWGEIMAKEMPVSNIYGDSQILYEVTASGIDQNWNEDIENSNRVRVRSSDSKGTGGFFDQECNFPFHYSGATYNQCTAVENNDIEWCSTQTDGSDNHIPGSWGNCDVEANELVPRNKVFYSGENICTDNYMHVCSARANYGGISVDWNTMEVRLSLFTPHENVAEAAAIVIDL